MRRYRATTLAIVLCLCGAAAAQEWDSPIDRKYQSKNPQLYRQFDEARTLLDGWRGEEDTLADAHAILATVVRADPTFAPALREAARGFIMAGQQGGGRYDRRYLELALGTLQQAIEVEPAYADAYVLLGHARTIVLDFDEAADALRRAEALGTGSPWLDLNWADLKVKLGDDAGAEPRYRAVIARGPRNAKAYTHALDGLQGIHWRRGELDEFEALHRKLVAFEPTNPYRYNNYAWFKLFSRGDVDGAIALTEKALAIRDLGPARYTLGCALLTKLARAIERGDEGSEAEAVWRRAIGVGYSVERMVDELRRHPTTERAAVVIDRLAQ